MHISFLIPYYKAAHADHAPGEYLAHFPIERHLPQALAAMGHRVDVVFLFPQEGLWSEGDVHYHFVPAARGARVLARAAGRLSGREWTRAILALPALRRVAQLRPEVIHFQGLILTLNLALLWLYLGRKAPPVIAHYHGGFPTSNPFMRPAQAYSLRRLSRALFTTREHAQPFVDADLLNESQVEEVIEVSTAFRMKPRAAARAATGMRGEPVFLWAGRLHPIKDPLTALRGFARIQASWPQAHLYCHYLSEELLLEVRDFLAGQPHLRDHVHLRGRVSHEQMEAAFNSADFLLQASRREYSGYAVLEAMACGVIPVVTDIPSFRRMTGEGRYGVLFPRGDAAALARRVLTIERATIPERAIEVRRHFEQAFSFQVMARRLAAVYRQVLREEENGDGQGKGHRG